MADNMEQLYAERMKRYVTAMRNEKPDMIPIRPFVAEFVAKYAGYTCQEVTHDFEKAFDATRKCAAEFDWDAVVGNMVYVWTGLTEAIGLKYYGVPGLEVPYDRQALAACTRLLADALAAKAPGGSTEVRIPPYAVVQCVEGPRHTRGTPPNVVETDPLTWIRLATGRLAWKDALDEARVSASGERADLSGLLPLMA